jgi:predicted nucleic acid-binding protein
LSVYADSSFVVSLYMTDIHSAEARRRVQTAQPLILTPFHRAEWFHALGQHQFRRTMTTEAAQRIISQFVADETSGLFHKRAVPENAFDLCADLARKHGHTLAMRTLDSLHVACALELKADYFWTFDERQAKLAKGQGLKPK